MILPYLYVFLVFPVLVGILSVDMDGNQFSSLDYIKDRMTVMDVNATEVKESIENQTSRDESFINATNAFSVEPFIETPTELQNGINKVWAYIWFLGSQSKDLGTWIGISTAPFHYVIAFLIALFALFINQFVWVFAFFYLLVTEWDEFKHIRKKDVI